MTTEENKAIVRRYIEEVINKRNLAAVVELYDTNYVGHLAGMEDIRGPEGLKQAVATFFTAFPDLHCTVEDMVAEGDKVVCRFTGRGTHKGEFLGIAATDKQATLTGIVISRIEGGKIVEEWEVIDNLGVMQQLGAIPTPGQEGA